VGGAYSDGMTGLLVDAIGIGPGAAFGALAGGTYAASQTEAAQQWGQGGYDGGGWDCNSALGCGGVTP
jgi:hypothetical protein